MNKDEAIKIVENALKAKLSYDHLSPEAMAIKGMTSPKIKAFLNGIGKQVLTYLEVGLHRGATFCNAIANNSHLHAVGIDDWSQFGGPRIDFERNLRALKNKATIQIYNEDCFSATTLTKLKAFPKFEAFFYDGDHANESQQKAVRLYEEVMPPVGILIVDDWKKWGREPTLKAVNDSKLNLVKLWELYTPDKAWWEGIGVLVLEKK